jgi:hypothetical protein
MSYLCNLRYREKNRKEINLRNLIYYHKNKIKQLKKELKEIIKLKTK